MEHGKRQWAVSRRAVLKATAAAVAGAAWPSALSGVAGAAQGEPIPIGVLTPLTGAGGPFGADMQRAIVGAVERINAAGGPLGRPIKLFVEDSQTNPEAAVRGVKKLIDVNKVIAVIGTWASGSTLAVAPICIESRVVQMSTSGASRITEIQKRGYIYRTEPDDAFFGRAFGEYAVKSGSKRAAALELQVPYADSMVAAFRQGLEKNGGKLVERVPYAEGQASYRAEVDRIIRAKPEVVLIAGYEPDTTQTLKDAYRAGFKGQFMAPGFSVTSDLLKNVGRGPAEGLVMLNEGVAGGSKAHEAFLAMMGARKPYPFASQTYDQIQLVALAIEAGKAATGEAINRVMRDVSGPPGVTVTSFEEGARELRRGGQINYEGASGSIDFDANGNISRGNFSVAKVDKGAIVETGETLTVSLR